MTQKASEAYGETDPNKGKRLANLERYMATKKGKREETMVYASNFLDKMASLNSITLNNYMWVD